MQNNNDILLKVENLCQYFGPTKAVDNVSFEVKKGEVFGLVGESGCGKTTTGRSIIKLYNITGGNVIFKGTRIAAGLKSYKEAIAKAKADAKAGKITAAECNAVVTEQKALMKQADFDMKNCDKVYAKNLMAAC